MGIYSWFLLLVTAVLIFEIVVEIRERRWARLAISVVFLGFATYFAMPTYKYLFNLAQKKLAPGNTQQPAGGGSGGTGQTPAQPAQQPTPQGS